MPPFFWLWLVVFVTLPVWADTLVLEGGRSMQGEVVEETADEVVFRLKSGTKVTLPRTSIQAIERSSQADLSLLKGDALFEKGEYAQALEMFQAARPSNPSEADRRIRAVQEILASQLVRSLEGLPPEQAEESLRKQLQGLSPEDPMYAPSKAHLARILTDRGIKSSEFSQDEKALTYFEEAWTLDPSIPPLGPAYLRVLEEFRSPPELLLPVLEAYVEAHPNDASAAEKLVSQTWERDPWGAYSVLCRDEQLAPNATKGMQDLLPQVLLACFHSDPYPEQAPLDRVACYELYLELVPDADRAPLLEARVARDPEDWQALYDLGNCLAEAREVERAIEVFRQLKDKPHSFSDVDTKLENLNRGLLESRIEKAEKRNEELEEVFKKLRKLDPLSFPQLPHESELQRILGLAKELAQTLANKPKREAFGSPLEFLTALEDYRAVLSDAGAKRKAREVLIHTPGSGYELTRGDPGPLFVSTALDGQKIDLSDYRGKVVVLYFWASWCSACRAEEPVVANFSRAFDSARFQLVGVSLDRNLENLEKFVGEHPGMVWPQVCDTRSWDGTLVNLYQVRSIPCGVLIDREGKYFQGGLRGVQLWEEVAELAGMKVFRGE